MKNDNEFASKKEIPAAQLRKSLPESDKRDALVIPIKLVEKDPAIPPKEFPINKWNMPSEPHGYIKGRENDCL